ncbi:MAG: DUF1015 domain-containing protein [Polyangiaceae bacterium]|nr:DUF1015 domain-containing protein [Polyangiaceae bacterium]
MLRVNAFRALRPPAALAEQVASVPYDVVNKAEARALAAGNELSFLHVVRPDIDLPDDTSPYDDSVYVTAKSNLQGLIEKGALVQDKAPAIYLYRQEMELLGQKVTQLGVVASCHIEDYNDGTIKKHEKTRQDKEDDRTRHVLTLRANAGPVFLLYKDEPDLATLIARDSAGTPEYDFPAADGVRHTVWSVAEPSAYVGAFAKVEGAYVADGHHRSASAARAGAELRAANPEHTGDEEYNWFLTVLFPASQLSILPYHRVVKDLNGLTPESLIEKVKAIGKVQETPEAEPQSPGNLGMYVGGKWYQVAINASLIDSKDPVNSLDYVLLYEHVLRPLLGIEEIRTDKRIDFVGGIRGTGELEKRVNSGECQVAFAMHATTIQQLIDVADAGAIMPPKSTWFEPKLRSGLLVHILD